MYEIVAVPVDMPVTIPVPVPIVAMVVLLLLHDPPGVWSLKAIVNPAQMAVMPEMAAGLGFTVTGNDCRTGAKVVIIAVPLETPKTMPVPEPTVAMAVLLLLHVPPVIGSLSAMERSLHRYLKIQ